MPLLQQPLAAEHQDGKQARIQKDVGEREQSRRSTLRPQRRESPVEVRAANILRYLPQHARSAPRRNSVPIRSLMPNQCQSRPAGVIQ
jgi:hypothetical protein